MTYEEPGQATAILGLMQGRAGDFTKADRKVARVLMANYPRAGLSTIAQIADQAGTSGPTVIRFVKKLGFDSFMAFQDALIQEVDDRLASPHVQLGRWEPDQTDQTLVETALSVFRQELETTFARLQPGDIELVAALLTDPKRAVFTLGGRYSHLLADYLASHLQQLRDRARLLPRGEIERAEALVDMRRNDVLVVFDYRRYDADIRRFSEHAHGAGAKIVLLTDFYRSPVLPYASYVLSSSVTAPSPFDSMVSGLALVETLIAQATAHSGGQGADRIAEIDHLRRSVPGSEDL
ncbi:MAG: MurR/RpiR family transcriptional regulator [Pseudomonadota bacterium]